MPLKSLSARLLILTAFFVMVGEVLIFVPSVARYRMTYFENRLAAGYIATLALDASPTGHLEQSLIDKLLSRVGAQGVGLYSADGSVLRLDRADPPRPDFTIDLTHPNILLAIRGSFRTLLGDSNRILRVLGPAGADSADTAEVLLDEAPLRNELWDFGIRILELSLVLSLVTAALVYLSLHRLLVRPMRRITASMVEFREDPEDAARVISASRRRDEIGKAGRSAELVEVAVGAVSGALPKSCRPVRARYRGGSGSRRRYFRRARESPRGQADSKADNRDKNWRLTSHVGRFSRVWN